MRVRPLHAVCFLEQVWLGIGDALQAAVAAGNLPLLQQMYDEWPFFRGMLDLVEMVMAKVGKAAP